MLTKALAALMANDVSASQQSCCSFDGTAFLTRALGSLVQVCKDRGEVRSYTIDFEPGAEPQSANALRLFPSHAAVVFTREGPVMVPAPKAKGK